MLCSEILRESPDEVAPECLEGAEFACDSAQRVEEEETRLESLMPSSHHSSLISPAFPQRARAFLDDDSFSFSQFR